MGRLSGRRALVTGASSGIGADLARELARHGADLVVVARRKERLEALAEEIQTTHGVTVQVLPADLDDPGTPERLFAETEGAGTQVDVLVNNAGFGSYADFTDDAWATYEGMLRVNVAALTHLCRLWAPAMAERGRGSIVNVASMGGFMPCPDFTVYAATKAYVVSLSEGLDVELRPRGVQVMALCPGGTHTEFLERAHQQLKPGAKYLLMSSERCARIGVRKLLAGRRTVVTGWLNTLSVILLRCVPRTFWPGISRRALAGGVNKLPVDG